MFAPARWWLRKYFTWRTGEGFFPQNFQTRSPALLSSAFKIFVQFKEDGEMLLEGEGDSLDAFHDLLAQLRQVIPWTPHGPDKDFHYELRKNQREILCLVWGWGWVDVRVKDKDNTRTSPSGSKGPLDSLLPLQPFMVIYDARAMIVEKMKSIMRRRTFLEGTTLNWILPVVPGRKSKETACKYFLPR